MPELPDITLYLEALDARIVGQRLLSVTLINPFLLRTAQPPIGAVAGRRVERLRRVGKRIAIGLEGELWLVLHLMIAGRLHWFARGQKLSARAARRCTSWPATTSWRTGPHACERPAAAPFRNG